MIFYACTVLVSWADTPFPTLDNTGVRSFAFNTPLWGAVDAEIKVLSDENTELKRSPFKAWSR